MAPRSTNETSHTHVGARLRRYVAAHFLALVAEWGALIGLLVYAYERNGTTAVGIASFAALTPYVLFAAVTAQATQRWAPAAVRVAAIVGQAVGFGGAAIAIALDAPLLAVVVGTALGFTSSTGLRPAGAVLLPALVRTSRELTAANVHVGYADTSALFLGPLLATAMLGVGGPQATLAACAGLSVAAALLAAVDLAHGPPAPGRTASSAGDATQRPGAALLRPFADVARVLRRRGSRGVLVVMTAEAGLVGASDVIWVVLAAERLDLGDAGAGVLSALFGAGSFLCALVLGRAARRRRLAPLMLAALGLIAIACFGLASAVTLVAAILLIPLMGLSRGLLNLLGRVLLQRSAPPSELAGVFGAAETAGGLGLVSGSLIAQLLLALFGPAGALTGLGAVCLLTLALVARPLRAADDEADVPVVEMSLLGRLPVFAPLPVMALEAVARHAREIATSAGSAVVREGEPGDCFYAVVDGAFDVSAEGTHIRTMGRGDGFGEIALLADVPRTATVTAVDTGTLLAIDRDPFLLAITGHAPAHDAAWTVVRTLWTDAPAPVSADADNGDGGGDRHD